MSLINSNLLFLAHSRYPMKSKLRCFIKPFTVPWGRGCRESAWTRLLRKTHADLCIPGSASGAGGMSPVPPAPHPSPLCSEDLRCPWGLGTVSTARAAPQLRPWHLCLYRIKRAVWNTLDFPGVQTPERHPGLGP